MSNKIKIEDSNLALALKEALIKNGYNEFNEKDFKENTFTKEELSKITRLKIDSSQIRDVFGLEYCNNLKSLSIISREFALILNNTNSEEIERYFSQRKDILGFEVVEKLEKLEQLKVKNELSLKSLDLTELKNLRELSLENNLNLTDLKGIEYLKNLESIELHQNSFENSLDLKRVLELENLKNISLDVEMYPKLIKESLEVEQALSEKQKEEEFEIKFKEASDEGKRKDVSLDNIEKIDAKAQLVLSDIVEFNYTSAEKIAAIYTYITQDKTLEHEAKELDNEVIMSKANIETEEEKEMLESKLKEESKTNQIDQKDSITENYADLMHYMLASIGMTSKVVKSSAKVSGQALEASTSHSVIRVRVGGDWYYFDPTLDKERKSFQNFFRTKEEFSENHYLSGTEYDIKTPETKIYSNFELSQITNKVSSNIKSKEESDSVHSKDGKIAHYQQSNETKDSSIISASGETKEQQVNESNTSQKDQTYGIHEVKDSELTLEELEVKIAIEEIKAKLELAYTNGEITQENLNRAYNDLQKTIEERGKAGAEQDLEEQIEKNKEEKDDDELGDGIPDHSKGRQLWKDN